MRYLFIGAHPDDADLLMGGTALKLIRNGHHVKFVSMCNGNCGHFSMEKTALAERRKKEAEKSAAFIGLDSYEVLDNSDCELENTHSLQFHLNVGFEEANRIICFTKKL